MRRENQMRRKHTKTCASPTTPEATRPGFLNEPGSTFLTRNVDVIFIISFPILFLMFNIVYWFAFV